MKPTRHEYLRLKKREWVQRNPEGAAQHNTDKLAREKAARVAKWAALASLTRLPLTHHAYYSLLVDGRVRERLRYDAETQGFTRHCPPLSVAVMDAERIAPYLTPQARAQGATVKWFDLDDVFFAKPCRLQDHA